MSALIDQLRTLAEPSLPGSGKTADRHEHLLGIARANLSLARLAEAHFDALAILAEAGRAPIVGATYGVWASEIPGQAITILNGRLCGKKRFCTGAGMLDRALVTVTDPEPKLIDIDLKANEQTIGVDCRSWITAAFSDTATATVTFDSTIVTDGDYVGPSRWYLDRPGFWPGAIGPAACWAGGAIGLVDWALAQKRNDAHTLAHLGALQADAWNLQSVLSNAGREVDEHPNDSKRNRQLALIVRHLVENTCADILTRLGRAYGPHPLAFDLEISRRYAEVELYMRQSHAERDLESLGSLLHDSAAS